jgi:serine protease
MRTQEVRLPTRLGLVAAVVGVGAIVTACLPPAPAPPQPAPVSAPAPTTPTTTAAPTTTTTIPPTPACPTTSAASLDATGSPESSTARYTAVVQRDGRTKIIVRDVHSPAEAVHFRADAGNEGEVLAFAPDSSVEALGQTESWGFTDDGFRSAWSVTPTTTGSGVRVAVLDTGVDATHPDLADHVDPGLDLLNLCTDATAHLVPTPSVTTDPNGHGTHVSGILAAKDDPPSDVNGGVVGGAPGVTVVPVRVLDASGSGKFSDVAAGILWAADVSGGDAAVISMSLGGSYDGGVVGAAIAAVEDPTNNKYTHPVIVVAAGNSGVGASPSYPARYASPNSYGTTFPQVLPVAALCKPGFVLSPLPSDECWSTGTIAKFSSSPWTGSGSPTGVSAPGTSIISDWTGGGTVVESGTSMATPLVAALAALVVAHCGLNATANVARIEVATDPLGASPPNVTYGFGAINPTNTLSAC